MRLKITILMAMTIMLSMAAPTMAQMTEQEMVDAYLKSSKVNEKQKLGWFSVHFGLNRINRDNDYNKFVSFENSRLTGASFSLLNVTPIIGVDFGVAVASKLVWTFGGEYWFDSGETLEGTFAYNPSGTPINITDPSSKLTAWGVSTGAQYYIFNPPTPNDKLQKMSVRVGGSVGIYGVSWDLWPEYSNLNLATASPAGVNTTYTDNAVGLSINFGIDYPVGFGGLALGADVDYLYLNFNEVAWYNSADQEIVASFNTTAQPDSRVDLGLSGVRTKLQLKRFFTW